MHVHNSRTHTYMNVHSYAYVYVHVKACKYDYVNTQRVNKIFPITPWHK